MTNKIIFSLFSFMFLLSCQQQKPKKIIGNWQAVSITEESKPLEVDVNAIQLFFYDDKNYSYQGTLKYKEAGTYSIEKNLLYTLDTINFASTEKAVKITLLTKDSLHIKMNENGNERIVKFIKVIQKDSTQTTN